ncbi:MAG: hypothetical protein NTV31_06320 [Bacteroidia bacterium]|nr:hypothetical protein [Bacteroidia bacterium]
MSITKGFITLTLCWPGKPVILEICKTKQETSEREIQWIKDLRFCGIKLTNATDGGDGSPGMVHSKETREKIAEKARGRISWSKGKKIAHLYPKRTFVFSESHKTNIGVAQKLRFENPQERSKVLRHLENERCKRKKPIMDNLGNIYQTVKPRPLGRGSSRH